jgi:4'-phosphopantetheinyl transferase
VAALPELGLESVPSRVLSVDERGRAARLQSDVRRSEFVSGRVLLRLLLGAYTGMPAEEIRIAYGRFGKPALADAEGDANVTFNTSCSHGLALYGIARGREVGVDVERLQPGFPCNEIAQRYFCPAERERLSQLSGSALTQTFFGYWSAKEALLKARGDGLSAGLDDVDLHELDGSRVAVVADRTTRRWTVSRLVLKPGFAGAVAVEGMDAVLHCWDLAAGDLSSWISGWRGVAAAGN